jgi:hypothetical protein
MADYGAQGGEVRKERGVNFWLLLAQYFIYIFIC